MDSERTAPKGAIWVCGACGKTATDLYGGAGSSVGWDESCMLNAVLCDEASLIRAHNGVGPVIKADPFAALPQDK